MPFCTFFYVQPKYQNGTISVNTEGFRPCLSKPSYRAPKLAHGPPNAKGTAQIAPEIANYRKPGLLGHFGHFGRNSLFLWLFNHIWIRKFIVEIGFAIPACTPIARPEITGSDHDLPDIDAMTDFAPELSKEKADG